jgi:hypothetical protein
VRAQGGCVFYPVSPALTDLGAGTYQRLVSVNPPAYQATSFIGGLYPGGSNTRPPAHEAAGVALAHQVQPLNAAGQPSPSGKIGLTSLGMSNTATEFGAFIDLAAGDAARSDQVVLVNGAASNGVLERWVDPASQFYTTYWGHLNQQVAAAGLTAAQVQVVWVKVAQAGSLSNFPADMQAVEAQYELLAHELRTRFANLKIAYFSSRTRAYTYQRGLSPEPAAFEYGFAVRWLIEKQLGGDPALNYDSARGPVVAPYLAWGPYLWIDGQNPRSDGRTWPASMLADDCTHPSPAGALAVAEMLLDFFKTDTTAAPWFLEAGAPPPATATRPPATATATQQAPTATQQAPPAPVRQFLPLLDTSQPAARAGQLMKRAEQMQKSAPNSTTVLTAPGQL